jgi:hypothetical protein
MLTDAAQLAITGFPIQPGSIITIACEFVGVSLVFNSGVTVTNAGIARYAGPKTFTMSDVAYITLRKTAANAWLITGLGYV